MWPADRTPPYPCYRGFRAAIHFVASANQNITSSNLHEKPEELLLCFPHKIKCRNRVKDTSPKKTFKISNGTQSLIARDIACSQASGQRVRFSEKGWSRFCFTAVRSDRYYLPYFFFFLITCLHSMLSFRPHPVKKCAAWTLLFWPQTCLNDLILKVSASPVCLIGKLCTR